MTWYTPQLHVKFYTVSLPAVDDVVYLTVARKIVTLCLSRQSSFHESVCHTPDNVVFLHVTLYTVSVQASSVPRVRDIYRTSMTWFILPVKFYTVSVWAFSIPRVSMPYARWRGLYYTSNYTLCPSIFHSTRHYAKRRMSSFILHVKLYIVSQHFPVHVSVCHTPDDVVYFKTPQILHCVCPNTFYSTRYYSTRRPMVIVGIETRNVEIIPSFQRLCSRLWGVSIDNSSTRPGSLVKSRRETATVCR